MIQKKVYIIVLNWNGKDDTIECLKSLENTNYGNISIIVSDNGSTDGSVPEIKRLFPNVEIVENKENLGFAGGNNTGIKYVMDKKDADYVLLINNDTTVDSSFLKELVQAAADSKAGILGPKIYYYSEPNRIWFAGGKNNWMKNRGTHIGLNEIDNGQYDKLTEVDYLTGCCLLVKKEIIEKVGVLSEDYFLYYEDGDFSLRVQKAGYKCVYVPGAKIYHKVSRATKPGSASYVYYHTRNGLFMTKRYGTMLNKIMLCPYLIVLFFKQIIKIVFLPQKREWGFAVLKAQKDFLFGKMGRIN